MNWLDYCILLISGIAEVYICYDFFGAFFLKRGLYQRNWHLLIVVFAVAVLLLFGINLLGHATLNLFMIPIILFAFLYLVYEGKPIQRIMYFAIVISVLLGCEFLFVIIAETTNHDSHLNLSVMPWQTFAVKLMSYIVLLLVKQKSDHTKEKLTNKVFWMYLSIPIASLGMMFTTYFISHDMLENINVKVALSFCFAFMLFGNLLVFSAFNRYTQELQKSVQRDWIISKERMNKQYYEKISDMNEKQRDLIHNTKHYVSALNALLKAIDNKEVLEVLNKFDAELENNNKNIFTTIPFLDIVLADKKAYAEECGVDFNIYVEPGIRFGSIKKIDYIVMLENLIENAVRATAQCKDNPYVDLKIFMENESSFLVTKIENNYIEEQLIVRNGEFLTTKKEIGFHGVGIKSIKKMSADYGGYLTTEAAEKFTAILILPIYKK